jgi:hypothetical protein
VKRKPIASPAITAWYACTGSLWCAWLETAPELDVLRKPDAFGAGTFADAKAAICARHSGGCAKQIADAFAVAALAKMPPKVRKRLGVEARAHAQQEAARAADLREGRATAAKEQEARATDPCAHDREPGQRQAVTWDEFIAAYPPADRLMAELRARVYWVSRDFAGASLPDLLHRFGFASEPPRPPAATVTLDLTPSPVAALDALGITVTATPDDIKRAFRRRASTAHPDRGGSVQAFQTLEGHYREALAWAERRAAQ